MNGQQLLERVFLLELLACEKCGLRYQPKTAVDFNFDQERGLMALLVSCAGCGDLANGFLERRLIPYADLKADAGRAERVAKAFKLIHCPSCDLWITPGIETIGCDSEIAYVLLSCPCGISYLGLAEGYQPLLALPFARQVEDVPMYAQLTVDDVLDMHEALATLTDLRDLF